MHDFAVERPHCVNNRFDYLYSDCGSTSWAYTLFISFNIISMYIFTNMFIVVVMHNFSYVYQIAPGFSLINRDEIRAYKRVWAEVDRDRTGYIQEKDLAKFLMVRSHDLKQKQKRKALSVRHQKLTFGCFVVIRNYEECLMYGSTPMNTQSSSYSQDSRPPNQLRSRSQPGTWKRMPPPRPTKHAKS